MTERTEREELLNILSDVFKDANGFRPRGMFSDYSVAQLRAELDRLSAKVEESINAERQLEAARAEAFEKRITDLINCGAGNRETAIRWDKATWGDDIDDGYYAYLNGLAYGYFSREAA